MRNSLIFLLLCLFSLAQAQPGGGHEPPSKKDHEKIKAARIGFITEKLSLTEEEAIKFWPAFNEMEDAKKALRDKYKPKTRPDEMTNDEAIAFLNQRLEAKKQQLVLEKQFLDKLTTFMPAQKIILLERSDREFKRELLHRMKGKRKGRE